MLARLVFVSVLALQLGAVVHAYGDPHKRFGYQPFPESSTFAANIVRVRWDGPPMLVDDAAFAGYRWAELVTARGLDRPSVHRHAPYGVAATLDMLQKALDYVATHTPRDHETRYLEAEGFTIRNRGEPRHLRLRSVERPRR